MRAISFQFKLCSIRTLLIITISLCMLRCLFDLSAGSLSYQPHRNKAEILQNIIENPFMAEVKDSQIALKELDRGQNKEHPTQHKCAGGFSGVSKHLNNIKTDWSTWSYNKRVVCPNFLVSSYRFNKTPSLINIKCGTTETEFRGKIQTIPSGSDCIDRYIKRCCSDNMAVPSVVHYVWYGKNAKFNFYGFLSFISVLRFVRPCVILIHGNVLPKGPYWKFILCIYPNIIHVKRLIKSNQIFGKKAKHFNHFSDVIRIEALLKYGGIYLDMDMVLMNDVHILRQYPCTMSYLRPHLHLGSSYIMAEKNSMFMQKWLDGYKYHYRNDSYVYSAMHYPFILATNFTNLIHVENETISRPLSVHGEKLFKYGRIFDWSKLYGLHLYSRLNYDIVDETIIRDLNTTFGAIARHILFGDKDLCTN